MFIKNLVILSVWQVSQLVLDTQLMWSLVVRIMSYVLKLLMMIIFIIVLVESRKGNAWCCLNFSRSCRNPGSRALSHMVRSSLIWSNDQSSAWFVLRGSFSFFFSHVPLAFILLSFKTFVLFTWMYSTGRLFLAWEFFPWMQITFLNLSQLVQEVCLMNHLEEIKKKDKEKTNKSRTLDNPWAAH